jgi:ABC-2 type transport system permease protein
MPEQHLPEQRAVVSEGTPAEQRATASAQARVPAPVWWRGVWYLLRFQWRQQWQARWLLGLSAALLALLVMLVALARQQQRWTLAHRSWPPRGGPTYAHWLETGVQLAAVLSWMPQLSPAPQAYSGACQAVLAESGFYVFSRWVVFSIFATFLLPIWSLTFASDALGRLRESGGLLWFLLRPMPRAALYLALFTALVPAALLWNLGSFWLLCQFAGPPGQRAFAAYWPALVLGTLAFCAFFHLLAAWVRRPAIVAILYTFFLETMAGNLPGHLKRWSLSFYVRCLMFDRAHELGLRFEHSEAFLPVSGKLATLVLLLATVAFLLLGLVLFCRRSYVAD